MKHKKRCTNCGNLFSAKKLTQLCKSCRLEDTAKLSDFVIVRPDKNGNVTLPLNKKGYSKPFVIWGR